MYQNVYLDKRNERIYIWDDKTSDPVVVPFSKLSYAYRKSPTGNYISMFGDKLERTTYVNPKDPSLYESDVPMDTRALIEGYYDSDEISEGHTVIIMDIETDIEGGFADVDKADKKITAISLYDKNSSKYISLILDADRLIEDSDTIELKIRSFQDEESMLYAFLNVWEEIQPTIVTGWNSRGTHSSTQGIESIGFDIPYLYTRIKNTMGTNEVNRLSPLGVVYQSKYKNEVIIAGVCTALDYFPMYKRYSGVKKASYQLGKVGEEEVGIGKIKYTGSLNNLYKTDIKKYIEYNLNDVKIVVALDKKYNYIDQAREICHFCHVPYEYYEGSSRFLEGAVLTYLKRNNLIACNKPMRGQEEYNEQELAGDVGFVGAYVKEPIPGKYDWVYDLDMQSLYPSIIQSLNISQETVVGMIDKWNTEEYLNGTLKEISINGTPYTIEQFKELITDGNYGVATNGVIYDLTKPGIIPTVIERWIEDRKVVRKKAKKLLDDGKHNEYEVLNRKQVALKILSNSIYGCTGLPSFRFYNKNNAEAVTLTGQELIKFAGNVVNSYYVKETGVDKDYLIYSDTDSAFASAIPLIEKRYPIIDKTNADVMIKATLEITGEVQKYINTMLDMLSVRLFNVKKHKFFIKQEMVAESAIWLAKKRYCQWIVNEAGNNCSKMDVKGIDTVRSSFPPKFSTFMKNVMEMLLKSKSQPEIDSEIIKFEESLKDVDLFDGAKSTSVRFVSKDGTKDYNPKNRKPFEIVSGSPAQVKAAMNFNDLLIKFELQKTVEPIYNGQKIRYVYLKENEFGIDCLALKSDGTDPKEILDFVTMYVDRRKMYEQELKSKLVDFYTVMKWQYPTLESKASEEFFSF